MNGLLLCRLWGYSVCHWFVYSSVFLFAAITQCYVQFSVCVCKYTYLKYAYWHLSDNRHNSQIGKQRQFLNGSFFLSFVFALSLFLLQRLIYGDTDGNGCQRTMEERRLSGLVWRWRDLGGRSQRRRKWPDAPLNMWNQSSCWHPWVMAQRKKNFRFFILQHLQKINDPIKAPESLLTGQLSEHPHLLVFTMFKAGKKEKCGKGLD